MKENEKAESKSGYTTESGGRQNGFPLEPPIEIISEGDSKKSQLVFLVIVSVLIGGVIYLFKT
tara:strand:- start:8113 stop:8301 length:189 start_codon:yes stop_codon:yes gene_type:complete